MSDTRLDNLAEAYGKSALEIRRLKQRCLALEALAREGDYGMRGWRDDNRETSEQYVNRRIDQIRAEKGDGDGM